MARHSVSRSRGRSASETGTWIFGGTVAALFLTLVGVFAYLYFTAERRPALDVDTLCPMKGGWRSSTVVLLDTSDQWQDVTRADVRKRLEKISEGIPDYGLLELRLLDPKQPSGRIAFDKCNPGDGSNLNELTGNREMARRKWLREFVAPLQEALDGTQNQTETETSPILSTIQRIAIERFDDDRPGKLVLVSDMIEHTPEYSQYKGDLSYERYKGTPAYRKQHTDLHGASVTILYVQRLRMDPNKQAQFWADWTEDNNGRLESIDKLQGAD